MQDFRKRRTTKSDISRMALGAVGILILGLLTVVMIRAAWGMYGKFAAANDAQSQAESELATLQGEYAQTQSQVSALGSERGQEGELRARYGVARPGEGEIDIVRQSSTSTVGGAGGDPWWVRLWHAVFVW